MKFISINMAVEHQAAQTIRAVLGQSDSGSGGSPGVYSMKSFSGPYQWEDNAVRHLVDNPFSKLVAPTGSGKTIVLTVAAQMILGSSWK